MSKGTLGVLAACAILAVGALAACGGDDDGDDGEAATATATSGGTGGSERLDEAQWQEYQTSAAAFTQANQEGVAKVNDCQEEAPASTDQFDACVGDSLSSVVTASGELRATLDGFEGEVTGACESARASFSGYLRNYEATANSLQSAVDSDNVTGFTAGVQNIQTVATAGAPARQAFESSCGPT